MATSYTLSPSFDHIFHYSPEWSALGTYHIPDTLITGAKLWTRADEDRLLFLNNAIADMREQEIKEIAEYDEKLERFRKKYATGRKDPQRAEIRTLRADLRRLNKKHRLTRKLQRRNRADRRISPREKRRRNLIMAKRIKELENDRKELEAKITRVGLKRVKRHSRGDAAEKTRLVRELKSLERRIKSRSRDITQSEEERILLLKTKRDFGGGGGGNGDGGARERTKKKVRRREAVALLK
jgi:hypothetical protein